MVLPIKISFSVTRIFLDCFAPICTKKAYFLILFLIYELSTMVEAKSLATNAYKNGTIVSKGGRYLTLGTSAITGEYSSSPNAKVEVHTVGFNGEVLIKGIATGKYLTMNSKGKVSLVASKTKESVFIDVRKKTTPFFSLRSKAHPSRYLAISTTTGSVSGITITVNTNSDTRMFALFPVT